MDMARSTGVAKLEPRGRALVRSDSTTTRPAHEVCLPEFEVPSTWSTWRPGRVWGTTTEAWNWPSAWVTADPTTSCLGESESNTIFTVVPGLKPLPLRRTTCPATALDGAVTTMCSEPGAGGGEAMR